MTGKLFPFCLVFVVCACNVCRLIVVWDPSEHIEPPNSSNCEEQVIDNVRIEMPSYVSDISSSHNSKVIVVHPLQHGMADCNSLGVKSDSKEVSHMYELIARYHKRTFLGQKKILPPTSSDFQQ